MSEELFLVNNGELIKSIILKNDQIKCEQDILKNLKDDLQKNMVAEGFERIVNDNYKIMIVGETVNTGINVRSLEKAEPELYVRLLGDYLKVTPRKSYVKVELIV